MDREKLYVSENDQGRIIWFVRKSDKWLGNQYDQYDEYVTDVDDMLAVSKINGIEYERVDIGDDPFTIVGKDPIYNLDGNIIFQSNHRHSPLYDFKKSSYIVQVIPNLSEEYCSKYNTVFIGLPILPDSQLVDAIILEPKGRHYNILFNLRTGELVEKSDVFKENNND